MSKNFRGGKKNKRDRWYGVQRNADFDDFKKWFHRTHKKSLRRDVGSREEMEEIYNDWKGAGSPTVKFLTSFPMDVFVMQVSKKDKSILSMLESLKPDTLSAEQRIELRELLRTTSSAAIRDTVALVLADAGDEVAGKILVDLLQRPDTRDHRGTLLYALEVLDKVPVPLGLLVELTLTDTFEAREQAVDLIFAGLYEADPKQRDEAIARLKQLDRDKNPHTRFLVGEALHGLTDRAA